MCLYWFIIHKLKDYIYLCISQVTVFGSAESRLRRTEMGLKFLVYSNSILDDVIHLPVQPSDHRITFHNHSLSNHTFSHHTPSVHICNHHNGNRGQLLALARRISCRSRICIWGSRTHNSRDSDWGLVQGWPMPPL